MAGENEIVFEDLHGIREDKPVTVDLDAGEKENAIIRDETPPDKGAGDKGAGNDDIKFDDLHGAKIDAPEQDAGKGDASTTGGDDQYSKKVKARISRATRGEKKAKDEASYWKGQAEKLAKDQYERDKTTAERTVEQADSAIEQTETDLEGAFESGESKDQVRLTSKLTDLKAEKLMAQSTLDNLSPDGNVQPFSGKVETGSSTTQSLAAKWKDDRSDWYGASGFERQTRLANRLDKEVFDDSYDPNTEEYFEELDKRIKAKLPDLYDDGEDPGKDDDDGKEHKRPARSPVAGVGHQDGRSRTSGSRVELTEDDFANMRRFGLDVNNPEVLKEYAANKRQSELDERNRS